MPLTHFTPSGEAQMVDVGDKVATRRRALAEGRIRMNSATLALIEQGGHHKGDVLGIARIAGIMAAKRTADLVPLCHPLSLTRVVVDLKICQADSAVECRATVETQGQTGVEMEALTAASVAALTIYDMGKAVEKGMTIGNIRLLAKQGGKSGTWQRPA